MLHYERKGRGDRGDTPPYAVDREIDDIGALIAAAGGSASAHADATRKRNTGHGYPGTFVPGPSFAPGRILGS